MFQEFDDQSTGHLTFRKQHQAKSHPVAWEQQSSKRSSEVGELLVAEGSREEVREGVKTPAGASASFDATGTEMGGG